MAITSNDATSMTMSVRMPMRLAFPDDGSYGAGRVLAPSRHFSASLFALAELFRRLVRQIVLAETKRRHQRQMLRRADESLELLVEGLIEIGIFLAEAETAMTLDRFAGNLTEGFGRFNPFALLGDLVAALGIDEHAGGNDVEAASLEAGNERSEFSQNAVDLRNAHFGEHGLRNFRRFAGELAVGSRIAEGRLIGETDANEALRLG